MIGYRPRLPLGGDPTHAALGRAKPKPSQEGKTKTRLGAQRASRWSAPNDPILSRKETLLPTTSLPIFRLILR